MKYRFLHIVFPYLKDIFYFFRGLLVFFWNRLEKNSSIKTSKIKIILFDFDDTIFPKTECQNILLQELIQDRSFGKNRLIARVFLKINARKLLHYFFNRELFFLNKDSEIYKKVDEKIKLLLHQKSNHLKKIISLLKRHFQLGIISNNTSMFILTQIKKLSLEKYFAYIFTPELLGTVKPDFEVFQKLISILNTDDILIVGNNPFKDILIANIYNLNTVLLISKIPLKYKIFRIHNLFKPSFTINRLEQILQLPIYGNINSQNY